MQHGEIFVSLGMLPGAPPKGNLETAELYGRRVAEIAFRFVYEKKA